MSEKLNTHRDDNAIAKRFATNESARVEFYGKKDIIFCRMNNLSKTGAFFEIVNSTARPKMGDLVRLNIHLRQVGRSHVVNGEIIWVKGYGFGVAFIKQEEVFQRFLR